MGAGASKPEGADKHVFSSNTPVQFSQELIDSLQASPETDSSRARALELHVAERVAAELRALEQKEDDTLRSLREEILSEISTPADNRQPETTISRLPELPGVPPPADALARQNARNDQSSAKVLEELAKLRRDLDQRKKVREVPAELEKTRLALVGCLKKNDRRPLDCWREVEAFKAGVDKMEQEFMGKLL